MQGPCANKWFERNVGELIWVELSVKFSEVYSAGENNERRVVLHLWTSVWFECGFGYEAVVLYDTTSRAS